MALNIPKTDKRDYPDILAEIKTLSESFTPEWNFNAEDPDIGAAAAMIGAKLLNDTIEKFNKTPEKNLIEFFGKLGAEPLYVKPSSGYLCFEVSGNESNVKGEFVDGGSIFNTSNEAGENVVFTMPESVYAVNSRITSVICTDSQKDSIHILYNGQDGEQCMFTADCAADGDQQRHALYFKADHFVNGAEGTKLRLRFIPDHGDNTAVNVFYGAVMRSGIYYSSADGFSLCVKITQKNDELIFEFDKDHAPADTELLGENGLWFMIPFENEVSADDASQMYIERIAFGSFASGMEPDGIFDDMAELNSSALFPFGKAPLPYSSVYFSCSSVLCKKGSIVTFEFRNHYNRIPINDNEDVNIDWKFVMKKSNFSKPKKYDVLIKNVVWEYFGGSGWVRLFDDDRYGGVFDGSNDGNTIRISFRCPDDISEVILPSGAAYAIRARVETVENFLKTSGDYIMPQMFLPMFSYKYDQLPELGVAAVEDSLKIRLHRFSQGSLKAVSKLSKDGKCLNFTFSSRPDKANIRILFVSGRCEAADKKYVWEYLTNSGWKSLSCIDETKGLSETGLLTLGENRDFFETEMFGRSGFWIRIRFTDPGCFPERVRFGVFMNCGRAHNVVKCEEEYFNVDDNNGLECALTHNSGIYTVEVWADEMAITSRGEADRMIKDGMALPNYDENGNISRLWVKWSAYRGGNAERTYVLDRDSSRVIFGSHGANIPPKTFAENVMISYTVCSGDSGNIDAMSEFGANANGGLISKVFNPLKMSGGEGKESISSMIARSAAQLRLHSRVCTAADIEAAVKAADRSVLKVRAFSGQNSTGGYVPGAVTVAVLFKDMEFFSEKRAAIQKTLNEMCSAVIRGGKAEVVKPITVKCGITVSVTVGSSDAVSRVQAKINSGIREYFDLEKGNIDKKGWDIGQLPDTPMIYGIISAIPEVRKIESFNLTMFTEDGDEINRIELERLRKQGMVIPEAGGISVAINVM